MFGCNHTVLAHDNRSPGRRASAALRQNLFAKSSDRHDNEKPGSHSKNAAIFYCTRMGHSTSDLRGGSTPCGRSGPYLLLSRPAMHISVGHDLFLVQWKHLHSS